MKKVCLIIVIIVSLAFFFGCKYSSNFNLPTDCMHKKGGGIHFSIDDSNSIFEDITRNVYKYESIFENPVLAFVKNLHDEYKITCSFYVFYSWDVDDTSCFSLEEATDVFSGEFTENAKWLRFGFHAKDAKGYETINDITEQVEYYNKTIKELIRITGSSDCIDNVVRLDRFLAKEETIQRLAKEKDGIIGLFVADDKTRKSYELSSEELQKVYEEGRLSVDGVLYFPTDCRIENISNDASFYNMLRTLKEDCDIELFTHEWALDNEKIKKYMKWFAQYAKETNLKNTFLEDSI